MTTFDPAAYWEQRLEADYSLGGVGYAPLGEQYNAWLYRLRRRVFLRELRALGVTDWERQRVLDVGSGTGFYVGLWHEVGVPSLTGADLTSVAVAALSESYPTDRFVQLDIGGSLDPLRGEEYDLISIMDVLFHIVDDDQFARALANLAQLLRKGGLLICTENFVHEKPRRLRHIVSRGLDEIEAGLRSVGFQVRTRRPMFFLMNEPIDSTNILHRLWWGRLCRLVGSRPALGRWVGAALYPVEVGLVTAAREGPGTELMICSR